MLVAAVSPGNHVPAAVIGSGRRGRAGTATASSVATTTATTASTTASTMAAHGGSATTAPPPQAAPPAPLVEVVSVEPTILVALNKVGDGNVTGGPLPGYEANRAFLQPEAAAALGEVQRQLAPRGLGLKVYDGYRPIRATQALVDWARSQGRGDLVGPYIASRSFHNSGQAVDLTLVSLGDGAELDMGTPYETFSPEANTANASGAAAENRAILVAAMEAAGFENYEGEWWHFNYFVAGAEPLDEPIR